MRMTRAARKAQEQNDEYLDIENYSERDYVLHQQQIHEDPVHTKADGEPETLNDHSVRQVLRDITDGNYPQADGVLEAYSQSPKKLGLQQGDESESRDLRQSTRKPRAKAKSRTTKKTDGPIVVEIEQDQPQEELLEEEQLVLRSGQAEQQNVRKIEEILVPEAAIEAQYFLSDDLPDQFLTGTEENPVFLDEDLEPEPEPKPGPEPKPEPEPVTEEDTEGSADSTVLTKTPKFDPAVHVPDDEAITSTTEDSFVQSIRSRSPAKSTELSQPSESFSGTLEAELHTPLRRKSSTKFEESFEAMDALEDTIEKMTADLPLLPTEEMQSPDSPIKTDGRLLRPQTGSATPNTSVARTPRSAANKLQVILKSQMKDKDKENTPPVSTTPADKAKTPLQSRTPAARQVSPLKTKGTPAVKPTSPKRHIPASARRSVMPAKPAHEKKPVTTSQPTKPPRKSVVINNTNKRETMTTKPSAPVQPKPIQKQPLSNTTNTKSLLSSKKSASATLNEKRAHTSSVSLSFSNSPAKHLSNTHQRRITSGGILSTSKPGFVPSKSSKPPTQSTFQLPGEAIAEKLKAQKEAREEKTKQPKAVTVAEQKAAKLKADREAREDRVRLNQINTQSTFQLPGEAVAEKLKAQREAREATAQQPQIKAVTVAEQKAAKLRADREVREERVRLNQIKADQKKKEAEEGKKVQRPLRASVLTISKARAEAAERGRQASKEWAEKMIRKKMQESEQAPVPEVIAVTAS